MNVDVSCASAAAQKYGLPTGKVINSTVKFASTFIKLSSPCTVCSYFRLSFGIWYTKNAATISLVLVEPSHPFFGCCYCCCGRKRQMLERFDKVLVANSWSVVNSEADGPWRDLQGNNTTYWIFNDILAAIHQPVTHEEERATHSDRSPTHLRLVQHNLFWRRMVVGGWLTNDKDKLVDSGNDFAFGVFPPPGWCDKKKAPRLGGCEGSRERVGKLF